MAPSVGKSQVVKCKDMFFLALSSAALAATADVGSAQVYLVHATLSMPGKDHSMFSILCLVYMYILCMVFYAFLI